MHNFMDAKLMAKLLRQALAERSIEITHSDSLELVSRQFGMANWNMLSAKIDRSSSPEYLTAGSRLARARISTNRASIMRTVLRF